MKAVSVSSAAISNAMRYSQTRMQVDLVKAQKEMDTGSVADLGLALGARTSQSITFHRDMDRLNGIVDSNGLVASRLSSTQNALGQLADVATNLMSSLTTAVSGDMSSSTARDSGAAALQSMLSMLNTSVNGEYLFAGINTDTKPMGDFSAGSAAKNAFDAAFSSYFGFSQNDPQAANITGADMEAFLNSPAMTDQFTGSGWANWSNATDETITSRIALNETSRTSVSANTAGIQKLAMAAAMVSDLFGSNIGDEAKKAVAKKAMSLAGEASAAITGVQAQTGIIQKRVSDATDRMKKQVDLFDRHILDLEGVDPYEAANRVNDLMTHIQTSYALTARIQQLSLLKFLT
ncbi:flagellar hook-associated family protein [Mesorhizobium sp. SP-1A]|uniref:flagellar hook-associated family protein n=1 Tax=Mesorhizobium sp. SP-1A TaxID=3077840 RepID=UPI0028F6F566|nr:flagellar hook-associated family protein [Mesorhizobium sp. SP-1A]